MNGERIYIYLMFRGEEKSRLAGIIYDKEPLIRPANLRTSIMLSWI